MTEARHAQNERKSGHRLPSGHTLEPIVIGRFDLPRLPFLKKPGGIAAIKLLSRPGDVIDIIISVERHLTGMCRS